MKAISLFWAYLAETQPIFLRCLHITIAILVIFQIINSNGVELEALGHHAPNMSLFITWLHISLGITLLLLGLILTTYCLSKRGVKYFYPYLWGDFKQINSDIKSLLQLRLPSSSPKGLAPAIQGLGLGALILVTLSGFLWFMLWSTNSNWASNVIGLHKSLTGLIEVYVIAHGGMGLLHFFMSRNMKNKLTE